MPTKPEPRRPGRPPLNQDDATVRVSLKMPSRQYADVCLKAQQHRVSVAEFIRRALPELDDDEFS